MDDLQHVHAQGVADRLQADGRSADAGTYAGANPAVVAGQARMARCRSRRYWDDRGELLASASQRAETRGDLTAVDEGLRSIRWPGLAPASNRRIAVL